MSKETSSPRLKQSTTVQSNSPGTLEINKKLGLPEPLQETEDGWDGVGGCGATDASVPLNICMPVGGTEHVQHPSCAHKMLSGHADNRITQLV